MNEKLTRIFLRDHLTVLAGGEALVQRMLGSTENADIRAFLDSLAPELRDDRAAAERLLRSLGAKPPRGRYALARVGEKAGRLKLNGALTGYTPLSRLVELEGLGACIATNQALWEGIAAAGLGDADDVRRRAERAARRLDESVELRRLAAAVALGGGERRL